jgi:uncharacterized integral membrane protein (TIGR00698 family)
MTLDENKSSLSRLRQVQRLFNELSPGMLTCITLGLAATFISEHYGGPVMLYALLFGMAFNFLSEEGKCLPGVQLTSRTILRIGVALLGVRITIDQVMGLGLWPVLMVIGAVVSTILVGWGLARVMGLGRDHGLLSGGAVAICGASAAMALSLVLPRDDKSEQRTIVTVVGVTTLSTLAMVLYPTLVSFLSMDNFTAGIFLGGTIHDVAQVVGAGFMISPETGDVSTLIKLMRVAMLVPVVFMFSIVFRRGAGEDGLVKTPLLPAFLVGFVSLVIINSLGIIPEMVVSLLTDLSRWCLVSAIAALGIKTSLKSLAVVGWLPVILMLAETAYLCVLVILVVTFFS